MSDELAALVQYRLEQAERLSNSARRPTTGCSNLPREKRRRKPGSGQRVLFTR